MDCRNVSNCGKRLGANPGLNNGEITHGLRFRENLQVEVRLVQRSPEERKATLMPKLSVRQVYLGENIDANIQEGNTTQ